MRMDKPRSGSFSLAWDIHQRHLFSFSIVLCLPCGLSLVVCVGFSCCQARALDLVGSVLSCLTASGVAVAGDHHKLDTNQKIPRVSGS